MMRCKCRRRNCRRKYIGDRKLPDKAIDIIDEVRRRADAGARKIKRKKVIGL
jgi:ATP-dependent Clp protease ATP-binding subunit ClpA